MEYPELQKFFQQYGALAPEAWDNVEERFQSRRVEKGSFLMKQGQVCDKLFFVKSGCLRLFYISGEVEITVWFSFENNSAIELSSFLSGEASEYYLEAIEDSEVLYLPKTALSVLYEKHPQMQAIMRVFWEDVILHLLKRFTALQKDAAEKRYLDLLKQPVYMQRIPQKYLASYIGVTPTSLSRIRKNIR